MPRQLTATEYEVLRLICEGYTAARIAEMRGVGQQSVRRSLSGIYKKLGLTKEHPAVQEGKERYYLLRREAQRRNWYTPTPLDQEY